MSRRLASLPHRIAVSLFLAFASAFCPGAAWASAPPIASDEDRIADGELDPLDPVDVVGRATLGRSTVRSPPGGQTWLTLGGFTRESMTGRQEVGGFVVVGLPFDRLARSVARPAAPRPTGFGGAGRGHLLLATAIDETPASLVTPRLARAVVEAAWRVAGLGSDDARLDAIVARARLSAVLPETRLRAIRYDDQQLYAESTVDTSRLRDTTGANLGLEARLTWRFDRLLYADDEPSFERIRLERHDARARIAGRVLEALFHWHRASLEVRWAQAASRDAREPPSRPSRDEVESSLRVLEAEATLDVLTAGWFTSSRSRFTAGGGRVNVPSASPLPEGL